jgi:hypothetical protein
MSEELATVEATSTAVVETPEKVEEKVEHKPHDEEKARNAAQRRIDKLTREKYELRAKVEMLESNRVPEYQPNDDVETRAQALASEMLMVKQFNDRCNDVAEKGVKANKDFAKALTSVSEEVGELFVKNRPTQIMEAILDADEPHKIILHLSENPELAAELSTLSPTKQIRRIAQIEKEMGEVVEKKPSSAPKPASPVKAVTGSSGEPDPKDTARWIKWENEKLLAQRARK